MLTYSHKHATYMHTLHTTCTCLTTHPYTRYTHACYVPFYMCACACVMDVCTCIHVLDGCVTDFKYTCIFCALYMYMLMGIHGL